MQGTIQGFSHGPVTPVAALLLACAGGALGLRCTARSLRTPHSWRPGRLVLGAAALGSGVWGMYLVAMTGFAVAEAPIGYDRLPTLAGPLVGAVMAGAGMFIVGYRGSTPLSLVTGGTVTGLSLATTHYLCMAGVELRGGIGYDTGTVALSVLIAVAGATAALWTVVSRRGALAVLAAGGVMGAAATGMHYTAMAAVQVTVAGGGGMPRGAAGNGFLVPLLTVPALLLLFAAVVALRESRHPVGGREDAARSLPAPAVPCGRGGVPRQRMRPRRPYGRTAPGPAADRAAARAPLGGSPDFHDW